MEAVKGVALGVGSRRHRRSSQLILETRFCSIQDRGLVHSAHAAWSHEDSILFSVVVARCAPPIRAQRAQYSHQVEHAPVYMNEAFVP